MYSKFVEKCDIVKSQVSQKWPLRSKVMSEVIDKRTQKVNFKLACFKSGQDMDLQSHHSDYVHKKE